MGHQMESKYFSKTSYPVNLWMIHSFLLNYLQDQLRTNQLLNLVQIFPGQIWIGQGCKLFLLFLNQLQDKNPHKNPHNLNIPIPSNPKRCIKIKRHQMFIPMLHYIINPIQKIRFFLFLQFKQLWLSLTICKHKFYRFIFSFKNGNYCRDQLFLHFFFWYTSSYVLYLEDFTVC